MSHTIVFLFAIVLILPVQNAFAVTCHCFKERSFNPSQPASADPYILATARNSLLAAAAGIDKGAVVRQRMTGATETDLWLSSYLSTLVDDRSAEQLLDARGKAPSWSGALDAVGLDTIRLGTAFNEARKAGDDDGMARELAGAVLAESFGAQEPLLLTLRNKGADIAETSVILYLAPGLDRTPEEILDEVRTGKQTWGSLFHSLGIKIDTVGDLIAGAVKIKN